MPENRTFPEAIVVLANRMEPDGRLHPESHARLALAVELLRERSHACLVTTGWNYRPDSLIKIAHAFRDTAIAEFQVSAVRIIADVDARDTVGDAVFVKRNVIEPRGIRKLTVVTSEYHRPRVEQIFAFVFGPDYDLSFAGAPADDAEGDATTEQRSLDAFRRTFEGVPSGDTEAIYRRLVEAHPFYNGVIHPAMT